jgi:hypothetical protein
MENAKAYEDLKAAKTEEIKSGQDQVDLAPKWALRNLQGI